MSAWPWRWISSKLIELALQRPREAPEHDLSPWLQVVLVGLEQHVAAKSNPLEGRLVFDDDVRRAPRVGSDSVFPRGHGDGLGPEGPGECPNHRHLRFPDTLDVEVGLGISAWDLPEVRIESEDHQDEKRHERKNKIRSRPEELLIVPGECLQASHISSPETLVEVTRSRRGLRRSEERANEARWAAVRFQSSLSQTA